MKLYLNETVQTGSNDAMEMFCVNNIYDAMETIHLMQYLQQYRPEKQVVEGIYLDASTLGVLLLHNLAILQLDYPLYFYETPSAEQMEICQQQHWNFTITEVHVK